MFKRILLFVFLLTSVTTLHSQKNLPVQDSLLIEKLTDSLDQFYTNPLRFQSDLPKILDLLDDRLEEFQNHNYLVQKKIKALRYQNYFLRRRGNDSLRLKSLNAYKSLSEKHKDSYNLNIVYRQLSTFWRDQKNYPKCFEHIDKAISIAHKNNDIIGEIISKSVKLRFMHSQRYKEKNQVFNDSIMQEYLKLYQYSKKRQLDEVTKSLLVKIVDLFFRDLQYKKAELYLFELEKIVLAQNDRILLKSVSRKLGTYYKRAKKNISKAIPYYKQSILLNEELKDTLGLINAYLGMSNTYKTINKHKEALEFYKKYTICLKAKNDINNFRRIVRVETDLKLKHIKKMDSLQFAEEKKKIIIEKENQELKTKFYLTLLVLSLVLISFILSYGIKYFKSIKKRNKEKELQLTTKIDKLHNEVSVKEEEVTELVKETLIQARTKEKLAEELLSLSQEDTNLSLNSIIAQLKAEKIEDDKFVLLKENIKTLNYEFIKTLKEKHPNLTKTDMEVCSFIKLGLSRKEIASLRKTSMEAIKSTRFRLKKKFQLARKESLDSYIKSL